MVDLAVLRSLVAIVVYCGLSYGIGRLILGAVARRPDGVLKAGSPVLGASALGLQLWLLSTVRLPWNALTLLLPWLAVGLLVRREIIRWIWDDVQQVIQVVRSIGRLDALSLVLAASGAIFVAVFLLSLTGQPLTAPDAFSMWLLKAKHFYTIQAVDLHAIWPISIDSQFEYYRDLHIPDLLRHPDYPPLFPLMIASLYVVTGGVDDTFGKAINVVYLIAAGAAGFGIARIVLGSQLAIVFSFLTVALPKFLGALFREDNAAYMGLADYALGVCMMLSLAQLYLAERHRSQLSYGFALVFAALAASIKNEGLLFLAIILLILAVRIGLARQRREALWQPSAVPRPRIALLVGLSLSPILAWQIFIKLHGYQSDLVSNGNLAAVIPILPTRAREIMDFIRAVHPFSLHHDYGWLTACLALSTALILLNRFRSGASVLVVLGLQMAGFFVVYLFTPLPLQFHLVTSFDRLVLELTLSYLLLFAIALSPYVARAADT